MRRGSRRLEREIIDDGRGFWHKTEAWVGWFALRRRRPWTGHRGMEQTNTINKGEVPCKGGGRNL
jgi:hypothetical protein